MCSNSFAVHKENWRVFVKILIARFLILTVVLLSCVANGDIVNASQRKLQQVDYVVTNLDTLGGSSAGNSINNRSWVTGTSFLTADDVVVHATLWKDQEAFDLGALGGEDTNSA